MLDPACGSGAFLIHTLEYLLRERRRVERELALVSEEKNAELFEFKPEEAVRSILSRNIFGVDINPASVEIARLALWLHTAKSNQPLTNLDDNIVTGNSLVGPDVYQFKKDLLEAAESKRETLNAFDFRATFKSIFDPARSGGAGFDCLVGNPPYVKLQNFKRVYPDTAEYLHDAPGPDGHKLYRSCQTGTYDLLALRAKTAWARAEQAAQVKVQSELLAEQLRPKASLTAQLEKGELRILADGQPLVDGIFIDATAGKLIEISWRQFLRRSEGCDAEQLVRGLRRIFVTENSALLKQLVDLDSRANALALEICADESALNKLAYKLFSLTPGEIKLVEAGS